MPRFDWLAFVKRHRIEYVTSGPNTARGHISVKCPFCGASDPSEHMGLSLKHNWWGCLRNAAHRGKSPARLVRQLLHCSAEEARRLVGGSEAVVPTVDDLTSSLIALRGGAEEVIGPDRLSFPKEFKSILNGSPLAQPFISYLEQRGYRQSHINWLAQQYKLQYATQGLYAGRIILPIYDRYGDLLSWTARTIRKDEQPRYRTLRMTSDDDGPVAKLAANNTVLGLPLLWAAEDAKALVIVEGPFDALKVTAYGHAFGVYATCLFGLNVYPSQVAELQELTTRFSKVYLLVDEDAELQRLRLLNALGSVGCVPLKMPEGSDDPGALSGAAITQISLELAL